MKRTITLIILSLLLCFNMQAQRITHSYNNVSLSDALSQTSASPRPSTARLCLKPSGR